MIRRAVCIAFAGFALLDRAEAAGVIHPIVADAGIGKAQLQSVETTPQAQGDPKGSPQSDPKRDAPEALTGSPKPRPVEAAPAGNPLWAIPLRQLSATRDRPLFTPSRRPPAPPAATVAAAPPPPPPPKPVEPERPQLALVGTIIGSTDRLCVFLDQSSKNMVRLRAGESHQGWTLKSVEPREATVQKADATVVIALPVPGEGQSSRASLGAAQSSQPPNVRATAPVAPTAVAPASAKAPKASSAEPPAANPTPTSVPGGANLDAFRREAAKISASPPPLAQLPAFGAARPIERRDR